jgi:hypothetical protein
LDACIGYKCSNAWEAREMALECYREDVAEEGGLELNLKE